MDPFSLALGVLTVIQTAGQAAEALYEFANTVQRAPDEIQSLAREANSLYGVLRRIKEALHDPKIAAYVSRNPSVEKDLASLGEPLTHCEKRIGEFMVKLEKNTDRQTDGKVSLKISTRVKWHFVKDDVNDTRQDLAQAREIATFAFSSLNFTESLRKNAEQDLLEAPKRESAPSPLSAQLSELKQQGASLRQAARDGDMRAIDLLLDAAVPVDSKDEEGRTALSCAAEYGNVGVVQFLIQKNAYVNAVSNTIKEGNYFKRSESKRTALHWAAVGGHIIAADALLDAGANIEAKTDGQRTPTVEAAIAGHLKTVAFLLDMGADVNAATYYGWTCLHTAAHTGRLDLAELLLSRGADVEAKYRKSFPGKDQVGDGGINQRALNFAIHPKRRPTPNETAMIDLLLRKGNAKISAQDSEGATALHHAIRLKWLAALELLLEHATPSNVAIKDASGATAFDAAVALGDPEILLAMQAWKKSTSKPELQSMRGEEILP